MLCICRDINKLINFENTFQKLLFNQFPYLLWLTMVIFIAKAHSWKKQWNLNQIAQEIDAKRLLGNHTENLTRESGHQRQINSHMY